MGIITEDIGAAIEVAMGAMHTGGAATLVTIGRAAIVPAALNHLTKEAGIEPYSLAAVVPAEPGKDVVMGVADGKLPIRRQQVSNRKGGAGDVDRPEIRLITINPRTRLDAVLALIINGEKDNRR